MTDERIKEDCPFCGCKAKRIEVAKIIKDKHQIFCPDCGVCFGYFSKQDCIDKWNRRYR